MCGREEDGAGVPSNILALTLEPGQTLIVYGRIPGHRPTDLFQVQWEIDDNGLASARAYELTQFDGEGLSLVNEWQIEV